MRPLSSRLLAADILPLAAHGLRTRPLRAGLSGLGVAIGIAAMVAVLGVSDSSKAHLLSRLDALGTNLLIVAAGESFLGEEAELPQEAPARLGRVAGVEDVSAVVDTDATVRRTRYIDEAETGGISVRGVDPALDETVGLTAASGRLLDAATAKLPTVVLGATAAERLGIDRPGVDVWIAGGRFAVIGILEPATLASELDASALVGKPVAERLLGADEEPSTIYVRADPDRLDAVRSLLGATTNPNAPEEAQVSRPSDALEAKAAARSAFTSLFLGLGAVALLVGGVGIANVMVIAVLERRPEIGLRRAVGARRRHVAQQFLGEALLLGAAGGAAGVALGAAVTGAYAAGQGWPVVVPLAAVGGGLASSLLVAALAGLYPALRAAQLSPTEALRSV